MKDSMEIPPRGRLDTHHELTPTKFGADICIKVRALDKIDDEEAMFWAFKHLAWEMLKGDWDIVKIAEDTVKAFDEEDVAGLTDDED